MKARYYKKEGRYYRHKKQKKEKAKLSLCEPVVARKITETFGLSEDIIAKGAIVRAEGRHKVCIENYRHIIEYSEECIRLQTKTCRIHIEGSHLVVAYYRDDEMCIAGNIRYL